MAVHNLTHLLLSTCYDQHIHRRYFICSCDRLLKMSTQSSFSVLQRDSSVAAVVPITKLKWSTWVRIADFPSLLSSSVGDESVSQTVFFSCCCILQFLILPAADVDSSCSKEKESSSWSDYSSIYRLHNELNWRRMSKNVKKSGRGQIERLVIQFQLVIDWFFYRWLL